MPGRGSNISSRLGFDSEWTVIAMGAFIGVATAFGAIAFAFLLHEVEHFVHMEKRSGPLWYLVAFPVAGALVTALLVHFFASEARGHGVPQVMKAIIRKGGVIPARIGLVKVFASITTVGTGGSAGTEGPIVQIGATLGSWFGQRLKIDRDLMMTFVGCGAAAGIASIFNAPIAGVFFVLEILLRDFSLKRFTPIVVASVFSTATTQAISGKNEAIFAAGELIDAGYRFTLIEMPSYLILGAVCGGVAVLFNILLHFGEDVYAKLPLHPIAKPMTGAALMGGLGIGWVLLLSSLGPGGGDTQIPAFFGNGYDTIRWLLSPDAYASGAMLDGVRGAVPAIFGLLVLLVLMKALATTLTLGSGGSGGVFAPSLFLGAATGAAFGVLLEAMGLMPANGSPAAYALVGMAAVVAGSTHAPLTAILILFELTRDEYVLLPIMVAAVIATVVAQLVQKDSIYSYKLRREGINVGRSRDLTIMRSLQVSSCELAPMPPESVYASDPLSKLITLHAHHHVPDFVVVEQDGRYQGMVTGTDVRSALIDREAIPLLLVAELLRTDLPTIRRDETLDLVMDKFANHDVAGLCVVSPIDDELPIGIITRAKVIQRYQRALEES
ncbi:MAG: chloride channel protein [Planctomycetota bacterium]